MSLGSNNTVTFSNTVNILPPPNKRKRTRLNLPTEYQNTIQELPPNTTEHIYEQVHNTTVSNTDNNESSYCTMRSLRIPDQTHESFGVYKYNNIPGKNKKLNRILVRWCIILTLLLVASIVITCWTLTVMMNVRDKLTDVLNQGKFKIVSEREHADENFNLLLGKIHTIMRDTSYQIPRLIRTYHGARNIDDQLTLRPVDPLEIEVEMFIEDEISSFGSTRLKKATTGRVIISGHEINRTKIYKRLNPNTEFKCLEGSDDPRCKENDDEEAEGPPTTRTTRITHPSHRPRGPPGYYQPRYSVGINKFRIHTVSCLIRSMYIDAINEKLMVLKNHLLKFHPCADIK